MNDIGSRIPVKTGASLLTLLANQQCSEASWSITYNFGASSRFEGPLVAAPPARVAIGRPKKPRSFREPTESVSEQSSERWAEGTRQVYRDSQLQIERRV